MCHVAPKVDISVCTALSTVGRKAIILAGLFVRSGITTSSFINEGGGV